MWDHQKSHKKTNLSLILLGSSSLQIQKSLSESLTGRFELLKVPHWSFEQSKRAFKLSFESYLKWGGYPGSYEFIKDSKRWQNYINESIIQTVIQKDILKTGQVRKPVLFTQTFFASFFVSSSGDQLQ